MADQRLPIVNSDDGQWGTILNQFLVKEHYDTGLNNSANGGHKNVTLRPGTTTAGTAPLKFTSGQLLSSAEVGAVEFLTDTLYFTQTTNATRKAIATTNDILYTPTSTWGDGIYASSVQVGTVAYVRVPYSGTIMSWSIVADVSCTCTLDVWKSNASVPTVANTITASAKPALASAATNTSSVLTGWTTSVAVGDVFGFRLDSLTGSPTGISLTLSVMSN